METIQHETVAGMLHDLGLDAGHTSPSLRQLSDTDSKYLRDLKLNVAAVLGSKNIVRKDALLLALAVVVNEKHEALIAAFESLARNEGASEAELSEIHSCASLMSANNIFYRFKHYLSEADYYQNTPAGLRMSIMMNPVIGKELFELTSLVVSAVNGCERCVTAHERSVRELGSTEARIYDAVRLAAVIKSLSVIV